MALELLAVTDISLAYLCVGGFVALFSLLSIFVREKMYINEVVLGTAFGVLMGPHVANVIDPRNWGTGTKQNAITMEVTRMTLAIGLFAIGVGLPQRYLIKRLKSLLIMVVPTMAFGWLIIGATIYIIFGPLNYVSALAIAACLTPTDPVVSAVIVDGSFAANRVSPRLRNLIKAESASNDGMAYPFISIALYLTLDSSYRQAFKDWFLVGWLYQVILGTVIGAINGFIFSFLMKKLIEPRKSGTKSYHDSSDERKKKDNVNDDEVEVEVEACIGARTTQYIALAFFTIGIASSIGSDDLLAAFAAGCAVSWDGEFKKETADQTLPTVIDTVFNCACFVYIGAWMPFNSFTANNLGISPWRLIVLLVVILLFRRIPFLLLVYKWVPEIKTWQQALFAGHFGPMGVSAVFVSTLVECRLPTPHDPPETQAEYLAASLQPIIAFVVLGSIIVHGLSIPFFCICERMVPKKSLEQISDIKSTCSTLNVAADAKDESEPSKLGGEAV